jgi:hypothetical protein
MGQFQLGGCEICTTCEVTGVALPERAIPMAQLMRDDLCAQSWDVRFGTQPPGKSRFVAIGRQLSYPLEF